jgi:hypothetical protein
MHMADSTLLAAGADFILYPFVPARGQCEVAPFNRALGVSIAKDLAMKAVGAFCVAIAVLWFANDRVNGGR